MRRTGMNEANVVAVIVPNPFFEGGSVAYLIQSEPLTLIDTGLATDRAFDALTMGLEAEGAAIGDVKQIVLTHKHIDHIGNAWRIQQQSGAPIFIHEQDIRAISDADLDGKRFNQLALRRLKDWQTPAKVKERLAESPMPKWKIRSADATPLRDGDRLVLADGELEILHTPGHTMGSICVKYGRYLFSGDHILPDISPNIGAGDMSKSGLLSHFFDSIERVRQLADQQLTVLPGHGDPFTNLTERCDELRLHHKERLEKITNILTVEESKSTYEVAQHLFGDLKNFHVVLGCAEAGSHLEYLQSEGLIRCHNGKYRLV
jgi:glyoxylase-like metal-dependent hydrolase (beta-lactamase superfamily II)